MLRPKTTKSLSDGVVVEASVVARLLGIKLLRVKAHVTLMPAELEPSTYLETFPAPAVAASSANGGSLGEAVSLLAHASRAIHDAKLNGL